MSPGPTRRRPDDDSFGRTAGMAPGRAAVLLGVAVVLGIVLLNATDDPGRLSAGPDRDSTTSTLPATSTTTTTTVPARPPKDVKVLSINGTSVTGVARKATDALRAAGFNVLAPVQGTPGTVTGVYYTATYEPEAAAVAVALGLPTTGISPLPTPPPVADVRGANVVVLVGPDLAERVAGPAGTSTTTTAVGGSASTSTTRAGSSSSSSSTTTTTRR